MHTALLLIPIDYFKTTGSFDEDIDMHSQSEDKVFILIEQTSDIYINVSLKNKPKFYTTNLLIN
jgi:hypothetical protein